MGDGQLLASVQSFASYIQDHFVGATEQPLPGVGQTLVSTGNVSLARQNPHNLFTSGANTWCNI